MIYGNVNNAMFDQQIAVLPKALQSAVRFLKETDLAAHEPGKFDLELDGVPVILQVLDLTTPPGKACARKSTGKTLMSSFWPPEGLSVQATTATTEPMPWTRIFWTPLGTSCSTIIIQMPLREPL